MARFNQNDDESTPRTGSRQPTGELSVIEHMTQDIKELRKGATRNEQQNTEILVSLARIEGNLARGGDRFDSHHQRILSLEKNRDKSLWALLTALGAIAWTFVKDHLIGNHSP